jgi:hypothetical protein
MMTSTTPSRRGAKGRRDPSRCFRTRAIGGRCSACQEPIQDVAHVLLSARGVYCEKCCPECADRLEDRIMEVYRGV